MSIIQKLFGCRSTGECIEALVMFLVVLLVNILIVRFLWNTALVKHITVLKPATTLLDTFLLALSLSLVLGIPRR